MPADPPIFIVGANRSGTTLLRLILNAHPRIAIPEELNYFNPWIADHWRETAPDRETFRGRVHWYLQSKMPGGAFGNADLDALEDAIVDRASTFDWRAVYGGALDAWAQKQEKKRWGEKTPGNLFYVDVLRTMFPDAQFIHLVRDPRAGVRSMQDTSFFGDDIAINALNRRKYLREGLRHDATMPSAHWTRLRYEDLLTAPKDTLRALCHFLGEPFTPAMLTYYEDAEQYMSAAAAQEFNEAARHPIDPSKAHSWREALSQTEVAVIEAICGREMEALNYPQEAPSPSLRDRAVIAATSIFWRLSNARCDAPEYIVGDSPSRYLRRRGAQLTKLVPGLPWTSDPASSQTDP